MVNVIGSPLGLWFGLGFCPYPHRAYLPTECSANLQSAFYPWPVVVRYGAIAVRT